MHLSKFLFKYQSFIFFYLFLFSNSVLNAATLIFNEGFEAGNTNSLACSGNCPTITSSNAATGKKAARFVVTPQMPTRYRTEAVLKNGYGNFDFRKEYWVGISYYYKDWAPDRGGENAPFQIHDRPSSYDAECTKFRSLPMTNFVTNNNIELQTWGIRNIWGGPLESNKWLHLTLHFRMSSGHDGYIEAWRDGVKVGRVEGRNSYSVDSCGKPMRPAYLKIGIYKFAWRKTPVTDVSRRELLVDNIKIAEGANGYSLVTSSSPAASSPAASSTPASSTPASSTPASSTPASSTPASSTPASSTPASSTPAQSAATLRASNVKDTLTPVSKIETSLAAHWPMETGTSKTTPDVSGNGHIGNLVNGAKLIPGESIKFDGVNDYLNLGRLNAPGNAMTISAWFRADDLSNCPYRDCRIISKATSTREQDHYFMISTVQSGTGTRLRFRLKTNGVTSTLIADSGDIYENEWVHVAAVYDGGSMILYKDGVKVGSRIKQGSITANNGVPVWVGNNPLSSESRPWKGNIADVRIYNYPLTNNEIGVLGNAQ